MSHTIYNKTLTYSNGSSFDFEYPIDKVLETEGVLIVLLDIPNGVFYHRNVFAFDVTGDYLWQMTDVELYYTTTWCPFTGVIINDKKELVLFNWCDTAVIVEPQTGNIIRTYQTK